jgi:hypothetical protein
MAVNDGDTTIDLGPLPGSADDLVDVASEGNFVALISGGTNAELAVIDMTTGEVARTTCDGCNGIAVLGTHVVSLAREDIPAPLADGSCATRDCAPTGISYALNVYDVKLAHTARIPISPVAPPASEFPDDYVYAWVDGGANGRVIVASMWSSDARRGPTIISLYNLEGAQGQSWTVDGKVYQSVTSANGQRIALTVGGSSSACYTIAMPVIIDSTQSAPIVLAPDESSSDTSYFSTDVWWNGNEVVTSGVYLDFAGPGPCVADRDVRRFDLDGQVGAVVTPHVTQYRLLGRTCDRALLVKTSGPDRASGFPTQVYATEGGESHKVRGYDRLLWSAPRTDTCAILPGLQQDE